MGIRILEFVLLYGVLPALCTFRIVPLQVLPFLALAAAYCGAMLLKDGTFDRSGFSLRLPGARELLRLALPLLVASLLLAAGVWFLQRERFMLLPRHHPLFWLVLVTLYPLVSVVPQEVIYRVYFFHRFRCLFSSPTTACLVCAGLFGLHHWVFHNPVAVVLSLAGGLKFAQTYIRTKSLGLVCLEHALYGGMVFTVGLGQYFASGSYRFAAPLIQP